MPSSLAPPPHHHRASRRWMGLALASVALHALLMLWAGGYIALPSTTDRSLPIQVALHASAGVPPLSSLAALAPEAPPKAAAPQPSKQNKSAPPLTPSPPTVGAELAHQQSSLPASGSIADTANAVDTENDLSRYWPTPEETLAPPVKPKPPAPVQHFDPPPPVLLKYDVLKSSPEGSNYSGSGSIRWRMADQRYQIEGDAGMLFISALHFESQGSIDSKGIAPELYSEKKFRRPQTNTHFHRSRNVISFSASTLSYPRLGGEQDRASIIWQLAAMARGDPSKIVVGADLSMFVAGVRDAEVWPIHIIGTEDLELGTGKTSAWHFMRAPKVGSFDQVLDIWLAPTLEWYPVKLRFTETNGDVLEMTLSSLRYPERTKSP